MIRKTGTSKTLVATGASLANATMSAAPDSIYTVGTSAPTGDGAGYALCEFILTFTPSAAPTEHATIDLYLRPMNIDGTKDADVPESGTAFKGATYFDSFIVNNANAEQVCRIPPGLVPPEFEAYINNNCGQTINPWKLVAIPVAYGAA